MQQPIEKIIAILKEKGLTDKQIAEYADQITQGAFSLLYTKAMAAFTDEDIDAIEAVESDVEARKKILELYKIRTGIDPEQEMRQLIEQAADNLTAEQK